MRIRAFLTGLSLFVFGCIILFVAQAQYGMGKYGYTYTISPPAQPTAVYNVFGQVNSYGANGQSIFQTYASPQSETIVNSFERLALSGVVWRPDGLTGCPPKIQSQGTNHWYGGNGEQNSHYLYLTNASTTNMPVGRHRLFHPYSQNLLGQTPKPFFVKLGDSYLLPPSVLANYNGVGILGC